MPAYRPCLWFLAVFCALICLAPGPARAAVFDVANEAELTAALATAAVNNEDDTINLAAGTYNLTATVTFSSAEINHSLVLLGVGGQAVLDGGGVLQVANFQAAGDGYSLSLQNLTVQHGGGGYVAGIGLLVGLTGTDTTIRVTNCAFLDNQQVTGLGLGALVSATREVVVESSVFQRNQTTVGGAGERGGGLFIMAEAQTRVLVADCLFSSNQILAGLGGAIYCQGTGDVTLVNNTIVDNRAMAGGGVALSLDSNQGQPTLANNVIWGNLATLAESNDIFAATGYPDPMVPVTLSANILGAHAASPADLFAENGTLDQDPALDADFRPTAASPGRDTGDNAAPDLPAVDLDGLPRVQNQVVDRGAYEYPSADLLLTPATLNLTTTPGQSPVTQIVSARSLGALGFTFALAANQPWLAVDPASGNLGPVSSRDVTVSFATGDLAPGLHQAAIVGRNQATGAFSQITVNLTVDAGTQKPVYRLYHPADGQHFYTTDAREAQVLATLGWSDESTPAPFYLAGTALAGARPVHRLYDPASGQHYLTLRNGERDALVNLGWRAERDQGWAFPTSVGGAWEVYKFYDPATGGHFYTANPHELAWVQANLPAWQRQSSLGWAYR
ncbi:MAG: right-handed parallel beta-helix repeat-containing protein [Deltaproteobacteria bacterium]|nr:right-handed parallel beta-helix repeat-containing protein [Deltaproteobacteria bacterium]